MKKSLRIIIIILIILSLILLGAWSRARKQAVKNGYEAPTFRAFLGLGTPKSSKPNENNQNENSSEFTNEEGENTENQNSESPTSSTRKSIFTNGVFSPVTPTNTIGAGGVPVVQGGSGGSVGGSGGGTTGGGVAVTPPSPQTQPECSDTDLFIEFTPEEINRLNSLKTRFFAIAAELHTDEDLSAEISNYDLFKTKSDKITELSNYCLQSPVYTSARGSSFTVREPYGTTVPGGNGAINYRVPTPFWNDKAKDNNAFIHQGLNWQGIFSDPDLVFPERSIEHALRLNLW
jgi:hypothetical protein